MSTKATASRRTASILQQYVDEPETTPLKQRPTASLLSPFSPLFRQKPPSNDSAFEQSNNNDTSALSLSMCRKVSVVINVLEETTNEAQTTNACLFESGPKNVIVVNPDALNRLPTNMTISVSKFLQQQNTMDTADWARTYKFHSVIWPTSFVPDMVNVATALSNDICAAGSIAHRTVIGTSSQTRLLFGTIHKQSVAKVFAQQQYYGNDAETILSTYGLLGSCVSPILMQKP